MYGQAWGSWLNFGVGKMMTGQESSTVNHVNLVLSVLYHFLGNVLKYHFT